MRVCRRGKKRKHRKEALVIIRAGRKQKKEKEGWLG